ncbi:MAG: DUF898 domain-containing protein [Sphingobium sp.]|nr:DUF898 domain-containing protein [Sphingobium sp.]
MDDAQERAFGFSGNWREYAPIAFTNLLLMIVTLGIYRFWAVTRTRQYLWSRSRFIDAQLEWTGTGKELLIGFVLVAILFGIPFLVLQFGVQALALQGHAGAALLVSFAASMLILYLTGLARYRALRYRLSRTYWHGIRGGSDDSGWSYGWSYIWKNAVGSLALGLMIPWSMMSLWDERWNKLSFGPFPFQAAGDHNATFKRFLLFYLLPILAIVFVFIAGGVFLSGASKHEKPQMGPELAIGVFILGFLIVIGIYIILGLVALAYYAKFFREAVKGLSLSDLNFHFDARTKDWFLLLLGDAVLVICTLGIGSIFLGYRHWKFLVTYMNASGEIDLEALTQSTTREPKQGEGLLDALDIGAF